MLKDMETKRLKNITFIALILAAVYFIGCLATGIYDLVNYVKDPYVYSKTSFIFASIVLFLASIIGIIRCSIGIYELEKYNKPVYFAKAIVSLCITLLCLKVCFYCTRISSVLSSNNATVFMFFFCIFFMFGAAIVGCVGFSQIKKNGRMRSGSIFGLASLSVFFIVTIPEFVVRAFYFNVKPIDYVLMSIAIALCALFIFCLINFIRYSNPSSNSVKEPHIDNEQHQNKQPISEKLKEIKELHDNGLITDEEYEEARRKYINML